MIIVISDPAQKIVAAGFTSFCELWNALRYMLISIFDANDEMKRFLGRDISIESTNIRAVLPDIRGVGACSRILLEFLIGKQNEFVTACGQSIDPRLVFKIFLSQSYSLYVLNTYQQNIKYNLKGKSLLDCCIFSQIFH